MIPAKTHTRPYRLLYTTHTVAVGVYHVHGKNVDALPVLLILDSCEMPKFIHHDKQHVYTLGLSPLLRVSRQIHAQGSSSSRYNSPEANGISTAESDCVPLTRGTPRALIVIEDLIVVITLIPANFY